MFENLYRLIRFDWPLHIVLSCFNWLPDNVIFIRLRGRFAGLFLKNCGQRLGIGRDVTIYNPSKVEIGSDVYIAKGCWISAADKIIIKDEVQFGPYVCIVSANHTLSDGSYRFGAPITAPITIGKGSWIGAHSTILMGVELGRATLIAANSVVNKSTEEFSINGGVPCRLIKHRYE